MQLNCETEMQKIKLPKESNKLVDEINSLNEKNIIQFRIKIKEFVTETSLEKYMNAMKVNTIVFIF